MAANMAPPIWPQPVYSESRKTGSIVQCTGRPRKWRADWHDYSQKDEDGWMVCIRDEAEKPFHEGPVKAVPDKGGRFMCLACDLTWEDPIRECFQRVYGSHEPFANSQPKYLDTKSLKA